MRRAGATMLVVAALAAPLGAVEIPKVPQLEIGGRFEYFVLMDEDSRSFPWNSATHSTEDRTRLMLDLSALDTKYGHFYLKGAAFWGAPKEGATQKRLRFEQGDYLWDQSLESLQYSFRLYANERRFFVQDGIAPILLDDRAGETGANRGVRLDGTLKGRIDVTLMQSVLGDDTDLSRGITYVRAAYRPRFAVVSFSYLYDDVGGIDRRNHAVFKGEVAASYRRAYLVLSYMQSGFEEETFFFPSGNIDVGAGSPSEMLPANGAAFAEARLAPVALGDIGSLKLIWRYQAVREGFVNDLGAGARPETGHTGAAFFFARDVALNARLVYHHSTRKVLEDERRDGVEGGVWVVMPYQLDAFLRGGIGEIEDRFESEPQRNYIHAALHHRVKRLYGGVHVMWQDVGTLFSSHRFALDAKVALSPNWALHGRFLSADAIDIGHAVFARLEYRPTDRIYATLSLGRDYIGDEPFVLEDRDIGLLRDESTVYSISLRGDF